MKVSFIIPAYQVADYIGKCLESIQRQTQSDWEVIVVDDGSTDNTLQIIRMYSKNDSRIKFFHQNNLGVSAARNFGIKQAKGDWLCFLDGDDSISEYTLEIYDKYLKKENDICFIEYQDIDNKVYDTKVKLENLRTGYNILEFDREDFEEFQLATFNRDLKGKYNYHKVKLSMPGKFYRRKFILDNRIIFPVGVPTGEDAIFNLYAYRYANKGIYIEIPLYFHRVWKNSVSKKFNSNVNKDFLKLHEVLQSYILTSDDPSKFEKVYNERLAWTFGFCCVLDYCHIDNHTPYKWRKQKFLEELKQYENVFNNLDLKDFRLPKKIMFFLVKRKFFGGVCVLCWLNRKN